LLSRILKSEEGGKDKQGKDSKDRRKDLEKETIEEK
jgi:hypothetical protein